MKAFLLPIGSGRRLVTVANPGFHTGQQAACVARLLRTGKVAFACNDPFRVEHGMCRPRKARNMWFTFYGPDGRMRSLWVAPTGRVVREVRP